jgi:hypothetical protein
MPPVATLEPVRFGEFLLSRSLITDEQWLAALADHWSAATAGKFRRIGSTIVERGFLAADIVEAEAAVFHDGIEVVEVYDEVYERSEAITVPPPFRARRAE